MQLENYFGGCEVYIVIIRDIDKHLNTYKHEQMMYLKERRG